MEVVKDVEKEGAEGEKDKSDTFDTIEGKDEEGVKEVDEEEVTADADGDTPQSTPLKREVDLRGLDQMNRWLAHQSDVIAREKTLENSILRKEIAVREDLRKKENSDEEMRIRVTEQLRQQRLDEQADLEELQSRSLSHDLKEKWHSNRHAQYGKPQRHELDETKEQLELRTLQLFVSRNDMIKSLENVRDSSDEIDPETGDVAREQRTLDRYESKMNIDSRRVTTTSSTSSASGRFLSPPSVLLSVSNVPVNSIGAAECHTSVLFSFVSQIYVPTYMTESGDVTLIDIPPTGSTLTVGSVETTIGTIVAGNNPGDTNVTVSVGELPIGTSFIKVTFAVTLNGDFDGVGILYGNLAKVSIDFWGDTTLYGNDVVFYSCDEPPPFHVPYDDEMDGGEIAATVVLSVFGFCLLAVLIVFLLRGRLGSEGGSFFASNDAVASVEETEPRYADGRTALAGPDVSDSVKREYVDTTLHTEKEVDLGIEAEVRSTKTRPGLGGALAMESSSMRDYRGGVAAKA